MRKLVALTLCSVVLAGGVQAAEPPLRDANPSVAEYRATRTHDTTKAYLHGVEAGMVNSISIYKLNNMPTIYCQPIERRVTTVELVSMIDRELLLNATKFTDEVPISIVLLSALQREFPCKR